MTSFAFILGVLPLYFATGAGKLGRHSVGTAIVGGMLFSTVLNLFFIPVLYVILKTLLVSFSGKKRSGDKEKAGNKVVGVPEGGDGCLRAFFAKSRSTMRRFLSR